MKKAIIKSLGIFALVAGFQANSQEQNDEKKTMDNILLAEWYGPYAGVPAFDKMKVDLVKPAVLKAMDAHLAEIDKITQNTEPATFENTIVPFEDSGDLLNRVFTYYGIFSSNISSPEFREVQRELSPEISEYSSKISQNTALFERIKTVYKNSQENPLPAPEQRVIDLVYEEFAMEGANLNKEDKERYAEINKELSELYTKFSNNVLAEEENYIVYLTENQLSGLPESYVKAAASTAKANGEPGKYAVTNTRSSMDPFLTYSD
ncbi:MAG TPA: hypothetical protein VJ899_08500, partial [Salegentibacter sp.]|nr:hypothetical protein [Salegentibacter sp.]